MAREIDIYRALKIMVRNAVITPRDISARLVEQAMRSTISDGIGLDDASFDSAVFLRFGVII